MDEKCNANKTCKDCVHEKVCEYKEAMDKISNILFDVELPSPFVLEVRCKEMSRISISLKEDGVLVRPMSPCVETML